MTPTLQRVFLQDLKQTWLTNAFQAGAGCDVFVVGVGVLAWGFTLMASAISASLFAKLDLT